MNDSSNSGLLRMLDANADRAAEGLRVVGDITRFIINADDLSRKWRSIRSDLWSVLNRVPGLQNKALESRDSAGDVGRSYTSTWHQDIVSLARMNIHRAQESLRVLEETSRNIAPILATHFSELRYRCYDLEPPTIKYLRQWSHNRKLDFGLYVVLGQEFSQGRDFVEVAEQAIAGGAGAIQLRDKTMSKRDLLQWAYRIRELTHQHNVTMIMNDHLDIALAVGADGVHLGQDDFPIPEARQITGSDFIIGASTHSVAQAKSAVAEGASYINIGPIYATGTKKTSVHPLGPEMITQVTDAVQHPFTVMGGIKIHNVDELLKRGARRIAVVTAVVGADDIQQAAQEFTDKINQYKNQEEKKIP